MRLRLRSRSPEPSCRGDLIRADSGLSATLNSPPVGLYVQGQGNRYEIAAGLRGDQPTSGHRIMTIGRAWRAAWLLLTVAIFSSCGKDDGESAVREGVSDFGAPGAVVESDRHRVELGAGQETILQSERYTVILGGADR